MKCDHSLQIIANTLLSDGRNPLAVYCSKCARQWSCDSVNFAPMGNPPKWTPPQD